MSSEAVANQRIHAILGRLCPAPAAAEPPLVPVVVGIYEMLKNRIPLVRHAQIELHGRAFSNDRNDFITERAAHEGDDGAKHLTDKHVGYTRKTLAEMRAFVAAYPKEKYNFADHNCWDFVRDACTFLDVDYPSSLGDPDKLRHIVAPFAAPVIDVYDAARDVARHPKPKNVVNLIEAGANAPLELVQAVLPKPIKPMAEPVKDVVQDTAEFLRHPNPKNLGHAAVSVAVAPARIVGRIFGRRRR